MVKLAKPLIKCPFLYFFLLYTWGIVMDIVGLLTTLVLLIAGFKPHIFGRVWYFEVGKYWGGLDLGCMFLVSKGMRETWTLHTKQHEYGHSFQNAILGPLFPFLVAIPSAIRYWYQRKRAESGRPNKDYDAIWFEGSATQIGEIAWNKQSSPLS